jgi:hypothetical protein
LRPVLFAEATEISTCSCNVFHCPQFWHLPVQLANPAPQLPQTYLTPSDFAICTPLDI